MNKIISSKERVFMALIGPSGSGKSVLIYNMLKNGSFSPPFGKILYFYQYYQPLYDKMREEISDLEFIKCIDFELIENLPTDGTNYLLIFDDSSEELSKSKEFDKLATAGRHRKLNCIYIKHNLFHKTPTGRDAELQNTHLVLFKSPRDVNQISVLARQLGLGKELVKWYHEATAESYGHLRIDLCPRTPDSIRYCTECTSFPSKIFLPSSTARITDINDKSTELLYSEAYSRIQPISTKNCPPKLFQRTSQTSL